MASNSRLPVPLNDTYVEPPVAGLSWVIVYRLTSEEMQLNNCEGMQYGVMDGRKQTIAAFASLADVIIEMSKRLIAIRSFELNRK